MAFASVEDDHKEILARHFLMSEFTDDELSELVKRGRRRIFEPHETVFLKGDPGDRLYAILKGRVTISSVSAEGKEILLNILEEGELFGEIAMLDGKERTADARARTPTELLYIDRRDFFDFLTRHPDACFRLLGVLCTRLRWTSQIIEDAVFLDLPQRLAKKLLAFSEIYGEDDEKGTRIGLQISQQELANIMGTSRESVNRQLNHWRELGLIAVDHGRITLIRPDDLRNIVSEA